MEHGRLGADSNFFGGGHDGVRFGPRQGTSDVLLTVAATNAPTIFVRRSAQNGTMLILR